MTNRDPYSDRLRDSDLAADRLASRDAYTGRPRTGEWSTGAIIGSIVAIVVVIAAIAYAMNRNPATTAGGPNTTTSAPSTTGQGGAAPHPAPPPAGTAR